MPHGTLVVSAIFLAREDLELKSCAAKQSKIFVENIDDE
jgi:hypothetical protein